ncbi:MAG: hypothetical protein V4594_12655 [Bacteroidota bacterium]
MKKILFRSSLFLLMLTTAAACKKDETSKLNYKVIGKWEIVKIDATPAVSVIAGDYYDFKESKDDVIQVKRNGQTQIGTYVVTTSNDLFITIEDKLSTGKITLIEANKLEFTLTQGSTTEKVYLKK